MANLTADLDPTAAAPAPSAPTPAPAEDTAPAGQVTVLDENGEQSTIPQGVLATALRSGYQLATPDAIQAAADKAKYGSGVLNPLKAGALGALRGATGNLSDPLLSSTGLVSSSTLKGLDEYNPWASGIGQFAGTAAAIGIAPEAEGVSAANEAFQTAKAGGDAVEIARAKAALDAAKATFTAADAVNPVSAVSKLGSKTGLLLSGALPELGSGAGLAARAAVGLGDIGAKGLGSAVEGAFYGGGLTLTEEAMGDPRAVSDRLLANIGYSALLGGGLGSVVEAGKQLVPKSIGLAKDAVGSAWRTLWGDAGAGAATAERDPFFKIGDAVEGPETEPQIGQATGTDGMGPHVPPDGPTPPAPPSGDLPGKPGIIPTMVAKAKAALTGTPEEETLATFAGRGGESGEVLSAKDRAQFGKDFISSVQDTHDAVEKASKDASSMVRGQETEALLQGADPVVAAAQHEQVLGQFNHAIAEMKSQPALYPARFPAKLQQIADHLQDSVSDSSTAAEHFRAINEAKQAIDSKIPWNKEISGEAADAVNLTKQLRGTIKDGLENEGVWGKAGARQAAYNDAVSAHMTSLKEFRKRFMTKAATRSGGVAWRVEPTKVETFLNQINDSRGAVKADALRNFFQTSHNLVTEIGKTYESAPFESFDKEGMTSLIQKNIDQASRAQNIVAGQPGMGFGGMHNLLQLGMLSHFGGPAAAAASIVKGMVNPEATAAKLGNIERAVSKVSDHIDKGVAAIVNSQEKGFGALGAKLNDTASGKKAAKVGGLDPDRALKLIRGPLIQQLEKHRDNMAQITQLSQDPESLIQAVTSSTDSLSQVAPKTASFMNDSVANATQYLASKIPPQAPTTMFGKPRQLSPTELATFGRSYQIVNEPLSILSEMKEGTLSSDHVQALAACYPSLYSDMQEAVMNHVSQVKDPSTIPYQTRLTLSKFMQQPLDASLSPQSMAMNQQTMAQAEQEKGTAPGQEQGIRPTSKGMSSLTLANRSQGNFEQASQRTS